MSDFDPDRFEDKYEHYFPELQKAYKRAFERMNDRYDAELVHAIDQQVLDESEPMYDGDGEFSIDLPADPTSRLEGVVADDETVETILERYVAELERQHQRVFGFDPA